MKIKKMLFNWRVIILLLALFFSVIAISPNPYAKGVVITGVLQNSSAAIAKIEAPAVGISPMQKERVVAVNNQDVASIEDFFRITSDLEPESTVHIKTNKGVYTLTTKPIVESYFDEELNQTVTKVIGTEDIGINVQNAPNSNIIKGLDIAGGTRVILRPETEISNEDLQAAIDSLDQRLNVYGVSNVVIRPANDYLTGDKYIVIEIAGITKEDVRDLLGKEGKFEAKIGEDVVFMGGVGRDIKYVCRTSDCSGIDPQSGCGVTQEGVHVCNFLFSIKLSQEAADRHAEVTDELKVVIKDGRRYLNESLDLYLDDVNVDSLFIGAELKGKPTTGIQISGSGSGTTREQAVQNTLKEMKRLQTILITGSLPVKMEIEKIDAISPLLGLEFLNNALLIGLLAILIVTVIISLRYKRVQIAVPIFLILLSELVLLLGLAALLSWNIDLAAIAGIIIAIGTGVDHLVLITDEAIKGDSGSQYGGWKKKIKTAMFIIISAFTTTVVGMIPLFFAGAGLVKGFAFTTITGLILGVFIARPAYGAIIQFLLKED